MPATKSGRIVKSRRDKSGPAHQKNHRWESFSNKISKLHSLDPLRKIRRHELENEDLNATTSYFNNGVERWMDLNISKAFTSFRREVSPLCDSLPQILHFQDSIMELLEGYISAHEKESLEPLLDLLTAFAHDLGSRFEKHYPRALVLIVNLASSRQDADVTEWTFACLAFLFKYLSRLLVPDIRPTYDVMAPLLGKARNPSHIARFAAEAMSFLIRKAAAPSNRESALPLIIDHARNDLECARGDRQYELYYHGVTTMFAEAIKGQGRGAHTTGPTIITALIVAIPEEDCHAQISTTWADLVCSILVSIVHHTDAENFNVIAQTIHDQQAHDEGSRTKILRSITRLRILGIMAGARKGHRIADWPRLISSFHDTLKLICGDEAAFSQVDSSVVWQHVIINTAIIWKQAPMDAVIPYIAEFSQIITREPLITWFIPFSSYFSSLDASKFRTLFTKIFQKYVVSHWSDPSNEEMLCVLLPRLIMSDALPSVHDTEKFSLPQSWQDQIVTKFERLETSPFPEEGSSMVYDKDPETWRDRCLPKYSALLQLVQVTNVRPSTIGPICEVILRKLKLALRPSSSLGKEEASFIVSQGFSAYLNMGKATGQIDKSLGPLLCAMSPRYRRLVGFLKAMLTYEELTHDLNSPDPHKDGDKSPEKEEDPLLTSLVTNLASPSADLRLASLRLLARVDVAPDHLGLLDIMLSIETTAMEFQNVRVISVHIRKLGATYSQLDETSWLRQAVPAFLFGMMTVRLTPVWDVAIEALKQISLSNSGEHEICERAFDWLEVSSKRWIGQKGQSAVLPRVERTDFECSHLNQLFEESKATRHVFDETKTILLEEFDERHQPTTDKPTNARSQVLKILCATPRLAEKRSRKLVPSFLSWSLASTGSEDGAHDDPETPDGDAFWSLADKKSMLDVFARFTNSKVLYQSEDVFKALLKLLANGDAEIQKSALKALLAYKQDGLVPYQENLEYLLDEARFKNELTVLFQGDNQIRPEHREVAIPVLLRLLYGRTISKKGIASGRGGLQATRLAVLRHLNLEDTGSFLEIALGDLRDVSVVHNASINEAVLTREIIPLRKQVGFLNMISAMVGELGTSVESYAEKILNPVLYCLIFSCRKLTKRGEDEEADSEDQASLLRNIRTIALKCVISLLRSAPSFNWDLFKDILIKEIVSPRLEKLAAENTEDVSGTLKLLSTLASMPKTALFLAVDQRIVEKLSGFLTAVKAKDEVKIFALGIIRNLAKLSQLTANESEFNELIREELLDPNMDKILEDIAESLQTHRAGHVFGREVLATCVETVIELSPIIQRSRTTLKLAEISDFLLTQPSRDISPKIKGDLLTILESFIRFGQLENDPDFKRRVYSTVASLFGFFKDKNNRLSLARVLNLLAEKDKPSDAEVANLCLDLNSYDDRRIDEPDFRRRLAAFHAVSKPRDASFTPGEWKPLVHNLLFYIRTDEDMGSFSINSADGLCRFIDAMATAHGEDKEAFEDMLGKVILPAIYQGAKDPSDTVRRQIVRVLGHAVTRMPSWAPISDLAGLDPTPDENDSDPSFFTNVLNSASTSRQIGALRLLSKMNHRNEMKSRNLADFFVPLLEQFIVGRESGSDDHGVGAQASTTIGEISISLGWPRFREMLRRFVTYISSKPDHQRQVVRLLGKVVDTLAHAAYDPNAENVEQGIETGQDTMDVDSGSLIGSKTTKRLSTTLPSPAQFFDDISSNILPPLLNYIHDKDETTVSSRVPVGTIIVKLLKLLPQDRLNHKLPGVLTDICHILRSKSFESRQMARDTLTDIISVMGPSCFGFVLDELRNALTKGYQLHILSYTMHSILVTVIPQFQPGDLDYCLDRISAVIMDDVFGATGQEKDAEGYTNKMKEVKSSKSQDSMELVAKTASISRLVALVRPLQSLLLEKLDLRTARKIDALLTRISTGLLSNDAANDENTMVFCYEVVQQVYDSEKPGTETVVDPKFRRYLVQKGAKKSSDRGSTSKHTYKLVRFALDILRFLLKKHENVRSEKYISGFIPIMGDAVVDGQEEVKVAVFKLLAVLVRVPFESDDWTKLYRVAVKEAMETTAHSTSTGTDIAQSALKIVSVSVRYRNDVAVKEVAVDMLLNKLKHDLTEPLYRDVTFNFLRSLLTRKIETAVVYDTLDYVGNIMITNDDRTTRDLARGAFFQFLEEYPQRRNRWAKQLSFVVANLKYDREGGRISVMEVIQLLLTKPADEFVQEVATTCFIPLVFVIANDDSDKCCLFASLLLKEIFRKADRQRINKFLSLLRNWLDQDENTSVLRLGVQSFGCYFESKEIEQNDKKDVLLVIDKIVEILDDYSTSADDWELIDTAMKATSVLIQRCPKLSLAHEKLWHAIAKPLNSTNATVKLSSIRILNLYLQDFCGNGEGREKAKFLTGSQGLQLDEDAIGALVILTVGMLSSLSISRWRRRAGKGQVVELPMNDSRSTTAVDIDETLAGEIIMTLAMLGKFLSPRLTEDEGMSGNLDDETAEATAEKDQVEDASSGEEWGGIDDEAPAAPQTTPKFPKVTLHTLFVFLSEILTAESSPRTNALLPKQSAMKLLTLYLTTLPSTTHLQPSLNIILTALHHLTDRNIPVPTSADPMFAPTYAELQAQATEAMETARRRVGTEAFTGELMNVTEAARRRREGRRTKRKVDAVAQPERYGRFKRGKLEQKVKRRKEKGKAQRERRLGAKF